MDTLMNLRNVYGGKKVLVIGLGQQGGGVGVARFFSELGSVVTVTDKKSNEELAQSVEQLQKYPIQFHLGAHRKEDFMETDFIIKGPSVPWDIPELIAAQEKGIKIEMEIGIFFKYCLGNIIGVTGTRGKSTTAQMIYEVIQASGKSVVLAGNMPDISTINLLNTTTSKDYIVLELSSFQLSDLHKEKVSPHIAVFTSFFPDHLNYYASLKDYWFDKTAIFAYQTSSDYLIANKQVEEKIKTESPRSKTIYTTAYTGKLSVKGEHNKNNAQLAYAVGKILTIPDEDIQESLAQFTGLPYRLQVIWQHENGVVVNDSTSTTPIALSAALHTFAHESIFLLMGGNTKNLPLDRLLENLGRTKYIGWIPGSFTDELFEQVKSQYPNLPMKRYETLSEAVTHMFPMVQKNGGVFLFSPGATSFATFRNEFDRARQFDLCIQQITKGV